MRGSCLATIAAVLFLATAPAAGLQASPSLRTVLTRIEQYVVSYEAQLSHLVAREHYVQRLVRDDRTRETVSDFLFLRLPGDHGPWLGVRDVLEVDGEPVRAASDRLRGIVAASPGAARRQADAMVRENARYNLGPIVRTVNVPVVVVSWMHPGMRDRFSFRKAAEETGGGATVWRIAFSERRRPTIVRTPDGRQVVSKGHLWVDPADGRLFRTELRNELGSLTVTIDVRFAHDERFGMLLPVTMTERYADDEPILETMARYSDFRRFVVDSRIR